MRSLSIVFLGFALTFAAKADLVPYLCQQPGSACGSTAAFTELAANSWVYNYSVDLSAAEQINSSLGLSDVVLSGLSGVTGATAPAGWTVVSFTATSVTFNATSAVNGPGKVDFGIFAVDTSIGGSTAIGSYTSSAWKLDNLADSASGGLQVNAAGSVVPEPAVYLSLGITLTAFSMIRLSRRSR